MVPLLIQLLAVLAGLLIVHALIRRAGVELNLPQAGAIALLAFFTLVGVSNLRNEWKVLDEQRERLADVGPEAARAVCTGVGIDGQFLQFVGNKIPVRERFYMEVPVRLSGAGDICMRMLLLPRLQVNDPKSVRYLVFYENLRKDVLEPAKRRGGVVLEHDKAHIVVRVP